MLPKNLSFAFLLAILATAGIRASAQAHVSENESAYIYVDATWGWDGNSGASGAPLKTIQAAIYKANSNNQKWIGTKVVVRPGTYRESVNIANSGATSAPLTVEASVWGAAVISGSDVLSGWSQDSSTIYSHWWGTYLGYCAVPSGWPGTIAPIARRAEMLFVNGTPMTEVMSYSDLIPGTFYVNEASSRIYVSPPAYTDMWKAYVEAAVRRQTVSVEGRTNVVLRGLVFQHAANCLNTSGAAVSASSNVLLDSVQALWNNWGGLGIYSSNSVTVQNSLANYNGGVGFSGYRDQWALFSYNQSDYNNWRGAQSALYDWAMGGTKLMLMRDTTVQGQFSYRNQAQGLWFDTDNKNITINNATLSENLLGSLQVEANQGPILLENSHLCSSGVGVNVVDSEKLTLYNNTFYNNGGTNTHQAEIFIAGKVGGRQFTDWQTGEYYNVYSSAMELWNNTFDDASWGQNVFGTYLSGNDWYQFANTLNAGYNAWYDPYTTNSFKINNSQLVTLGGFRNATGTDYSSYWGKPSTSPAGPCWVSTPSYTDFSVNLDQESYAMYAGQTSATVRVNSYGYGWVNMWVTGMPSGTWATLSQQGLVSGAVTLKLNAENWASYQTVPVTLWATSGSRVHSVTFYLYVTPS